MPKIDGINPGFAAPLTPKPADGGGSKVGASFAEALSKAVSPASSRGSLGDPRHIPLPGSARAAEGFQERALGIRAQRQELIASNIANADTPSYKTVDIDVREAMLDALNATALPLTLSTTSAKHVPRQVPGVFLGPTVKYHIPTQSSADGNTVDMDVERSKFAENALMYEFSLDRVKGHYKDLIDLLNSIK